MLSINERFTELYDRHYSAVYRYFFYKTGNRQLTEDLTAETFIKVYSGLPRFDDKKASVGTWLMTLAKNVYIDNYREQKNKIYVSDDVLRDAHDAADTERTVLAADTYRLLYAAMAELSEKDRNLIALKYASDYKNKEIALLLGKSERHTAVMLGRAIEKLRKILIKMGVDGYE